MSKENYGMLQYFKSILCGGVAGISVDLILFPLDTIKTRLQSKKKFDNMNQVGGKQISKYAGLKSSMMASFPSAAAFFSTYDFTKYFLKDRVKIKNYDVLIHMLSAVAGEASQAFVRNPFELIKQNMQIGKYENITSAIKMILQKQGFTGFYRGYSVTLVREIPFGLVQYPLYEYFKNNNKKTTIELCLCGAKAGGIAAVLTTPIDVIKTRIMTNDLTINHIIPLIKNIYTNEGISALFKGVSVRFIYISIGGMIFFGSNEFMKKSLGFNNNV